MEVFELDNPANLVIREELTCKSIVLDVKKGILLEDGASVTVKARGDEDHSDIEEFFRVPMAEVLGPMSEVDGFVIEAFLHDQGGLRFVIVGDIEAHSKGDIVYIPRSAHHTIAAACGSAPYPQRTMPLGLLLSIRDKEEEIFKNLATRIAEYPSMYLTSQEHVRYYLCRDSCATREDLDARWYL